MTEKTSTRNPFSVEPDLFVDGFGDDADFRQMGLEARHQIVPPLEIVICLLQQDENACNKHERVSKNNVSYSRKTNKEQRRMNDG